MGYSTKNQNREAGGWGGGGGGVGDMEFLRVSITLRS